MNEPITVVCVLPVEAVEALAEEIAGKIAARLSAAPTPTTISSTYLTIPEAAEYLRCSRQRVDDLLSARRLTRVKEGRRTLVRRCEIDAYLREIA